MKGTRISELLKWTADDLYDHDLVVLSTQRLERDEDGEEVVQRTVSVSLGELKKYLRKEEKRESYWSRWVRKSR